MNDRSFIDAIAHLLAKYRAHVREETLAEVRRKLAISATVPISRGRGRPPASSGMSQRSRIVSALQERPWMTLRELKGSLPDVNSYSVQVLVSRLVSHGKLQKRGTPGAYEYALPIASAAE